MHWSWKTTTAPASEPLSLADAKSHLRVTDSTEDDLITAYIVAARKWIENYCNRSLFTQTITANFDRFPYDGQNILLPQSPVASITSVSYVDTNGDTQVWDSSNYNIDTINEPARLSTAYNASWPSTRHQNNAVTVVYVAGAANVEEDIVHALKLIVGSFYANREADCPQQLYAPDLSVNALLSTYRLRYRGPWV